MSHKPLGKIAFVGTGGTIASEGSDVYDLLDYNANGKLHTSQVIIDKTGVSNLADVNVIDIGPIDSTEIRDEHWGQLADTCCTLSEDPELRGIVIGHGTASLKETAWVLSLVLDLKKPVVVTGSMRPLNATSSDASANMTAAFRVAAHEFPPNEPPGVLVVMNDRIFSPRSVTKTHTTQLHAFQAPYLGYLHGDKVNIISRQTSPVSGRFHRSLIKNLPRVDIVTSYVGADEVQIKACVEAGARGLVSAGFAPGLGTPQEICAFKKAIFKGVTVVQSSRVGAGEVVDSQHHKGIGIIAGKDLTPAKARILLRFCLARGHDKSTIEMVFGNV